jgi:long-chain acyl-CoA synthetase
MTHPSVHARTQPNKIAYQMAGSGKAISYRELDEMSNQGAHLFRSLGLKQGDHIAFLIENRLAFMEICWAAQRRHRVDFAMAVASRHGGARRGRQNQNSRRE